VQRQVIEKQKQQPVQRKPESSFLGRTHVNPFLQAQNIIGNHGLLRLSDGTLLHRKLEVGPADDECEREADRIADEVMRMPEPEARSSSTVHRSPLVGPHSSLLVPHSSLSHGTELPPEVETRIQSLRASGGRPLSEPERAFFEPRFGLDFSDVRIHEGPAATKATSAVNAKAFTVGQDVMFSTNWGVSPSTPGRRLLAHELTHALQRPTHGAQDLRRQQDVEVLETCVDIRMLTDDELLEYYDQIVQQLQEYAATGTCSPEEEYLLTQVAAVATEFSRREALSAGRTFSEEAVGRMRQFFQDNATSDSPLSCIGTMNKGLQTLYAQKISVGTEVQTTMAKLVGSGRAGTARIVEFTDAQGQETTGVRRPATLQEDVWVVLQDMAGSDTGWSVFGLSLMDGFHSVTLTLDTTDPSTPHVYWSDQWGETGGWLELNQAGLNARITELTQQWWDQQPANKKHRTRATLWRLHQ